jgi:NitT/TauT family transport system permease protein
MSVTAISLRSKASHGWQGAASLLAMFILWQIAALSADSRWLPEPLTVTNLLWTETAHGPLLHHLDITLARVALSLAIALIAGSAFGYALGRSNVADRWLKPWLVVLLNVPALVTVVLVYIWLGLTEAALIVAVALNKLPTIAVTIREGAGRLDRELAQVAELYRFSWGVRFRQVVLPQLLPYLLVAARNGLALTWKIVLVAELLGRSSGVGFQLQLYFQNFDVGRILAYTVAFTASMLAIEYALLAPLERRLTLWRR